MTTVKYFPSDTPWVSDKYKWQIIQHIKRPSGFFFFFWEIRELWGPQYTSVVLCFTRKFSVWQTVCFFHVVWWTTAGSKVSTSHKCGNIYKGDYMLLFHIFLRCLQGRLFLLSPYKKSFNLFNWVTYSTHLTELRLKVQSVDVTICLFNCDVCDLPFTDLTKMKTTSGLQP